MFLACKCCEVDRKWQFANSFWSKSNIFSNKQAQASARQWLWVCLPSAQSEPPNNEQNKQTDQVPVAVLFHPCQVQHSPLSSDSSPADSSRPRHPTWSRMIFCSVRTNNSPVSFTAWVKLTLGEKRGWVMLGIAEKSSHKYRVNTHWKDHEQKSDLGKHLGCSVRMPIAMRFWAFHTLPTPQKNAL